MLPAYVLFVAYFHCGTYATLYFIANCLVLPFIVGEFQIGKNRKFYLACSSIRKPPLIQVEWRAALILIINLNNTFGLVLVPVQGTILQVIICCTVILSRNFHDMHRSTKLIYIGWSILCGGVWSSALLLFGYLHYYTSKILESWQLHTWAELSIKEKKCLLKFRKPLAIAYKTLFIIQRLTVLKFMKKLLTRILRALLKFKKHSLQ